MGTTPALSPALSGNLRFPHIYGGIPSSGVVVEERNVFRGPEGEYLGIEGLCGVEEGDVEERWRVHKLKRGAMIVATAVAAIALVPFLGKGRS